jgi:hypothetical protein
LDQAVGNQEKHVFKTIINEKPFVVEVRRQHQGLNISCNGGDPNIIPLILEAISFLLTHS